MTETARQFQDEATRRAQQAHALRDAEASEPQAVIGAYREALAAAERYLVVAPDAPDRAFWHGFADSTRRWLVQVGGLVPTVPAANTAPAGGAPLRLVGDEDVGEDGEDVDAGAAPVADESDEWKRALAVDRRGEPLSVPGNADLYLRFHPALRTMIRWNAFAKRVEVQGGALARLASDSPTLEDITVTAEDWFQFETRMSIRHTDLKRRIVAVAHQNAYNPLVDYLASIQWDGTPRIDGFLVDLLGARTISRDKKDVSAHVRRISRRWFISAVARAFDPGCQVDTVLILEGRPGLKKCLGRGTSVLMFDGSIKPVEEVRDGDLLMGPDSRPRKVRETVVGHGSLRRIVPTKGDPWVCNDSHILTVAQIGGQIVDVPITNCISRKGETVARGDLVNVREVAKVRGYLKTARFKGPDIERIRKMYDAGNSMDKIARKLGSSYTAIRNALRRQNVEEVMSLATTPRLRAGRVLQVRTGVEFRRRELPLDPYLTGVWLGDGTVGKAEITSADNEIIEFCKNIAPQYGVEVKLTPDLRRPHVVAVRFTTGNKKGQVRKSRNYILDMIRTFMIDGEKRIPRQYLVNNRANRLSLLAGILDTDGCLSGGCFMITTRYVGLKDDILFLARSLGLAAYSRCYPGPGKYSENLYHGIVISGDLSIIPCRLPRKQAMTRKQIKSVLRTGFVIEDAGEGEFFGFELDGDGRFLLGDFTITHNTSAFRALGGEYHCETEMPIGGNKDSKQLASTRWIVELAELDSFRGRETSTINAYLTQRIDYYRPPYAAEHQAFPRLCVFVGTTNKEEYIEDSTGDRRYWPVWVDRIDYRRIEESRDQLWAEAVFAYLGGGFDRCEACVTSYATGGEVRCADHRWWLDASEQGVASEHVAERAMPVVYEERILEWWLGLGKTAMSARAVDPEGFTFSDVAEHALKLVPKDWPRESRAIGMALRRLGFERTDDARPRRYHSTDKLRQLKVVGR